MELLKPKKLKQGDVIGLISPASLPKDISRIEKGVKYLESLGYRVEVGKNVGKERGYLAGTDEERLEDLHNMFANKDVNAIFCVRGGYGTGRLLDQIDYKLIKKNPKIFVGYSDITALQMAFLKKCGLVTFAGPMVAVDFHDEISDFTMENFWRVITSSKKIGKLENPDEEKLYILDKGRAEGQLIGGNLALFTSLFGTGYLPDLSESILMFEEIGEEPYRLDRMFKQLSFQKNFNKINGVILGRFKGCTDEDEKEGKSLSLNDVIGDYWANKEYPVIYNFKHGHISDNLTVPFGVNCKMNTSRSFIEITEGAVSS